MELKHIPLDQLHISPLNMRHGKKQPDISDILPSVRSRGILQPLLVRPNNSGFEIVAGRRRYFSAKAVEAEGGAVAPVPCAVMDTNDDTAAVEASLIENIARLDADEMTQYETFFRLIREGRSVEDIAATFGLTELAVKQRLALGNLLPKIRAAYRAENIDANTLRLLTMASKAQQKAWLDLFESGDEEEPTGWYLKQWLFGGESISTATALFPLDSYKGQIVGDLFGEESYFGDVAQFWELQNAAIEAKRETYLAARWPDVVVLEAGQRFMQWEHEKTAKRKGGKVYIAVSARGEVECFEGYLPRKQTKKAKAKADDAVPAARPAMTKAMENYLDLHRHAAVRLALVANPATAFRLLVAHAVASSGNWTVKPDSQRANSDAIHASIQNSAAQTAFVAERDAVETLLDAPDDQSGDKHTARIFARLMELSDAEVMRVAAFVMAETLAVGSVAVEAAGNILNADPRGQWQADDVFLDLIRDRATVKAIVADVAGKPTANRNADRKTAAQKQIVRDALDGKNGRAKVENWLPRWMAFPFKTYGDGTCGIAERAAFAKSLRNGA